MLSSLDKLTSNLSKNQFRETRKYLEPLYVQQPNQPQTNNEIEGADEGEAMHNHEDYWNHAYQLPTLTPGEQRQIEEDLALLTRKGVYPHGHVYSFEQFQEPQLSPKDAFYNSLTEEDSSEMSTALAWKIRTSANAIATQYIRTPTTYMDGWCHNLDPRLISNASQTRKWKT